MRLDKRSQTERRVVSALNASTDGFDRRDGGLRGTRDDQVNRRLEMRSTFAEDLDAVLERVNAACFVELLGGDRAGRIEKAAVDPVLDLVKVDGDICLTVTAKT